MAIDAARPGAKPRPPVHCGPVALNVQIFALGANPSPSLAGLARTLHGRDRLGAGCGRGATGGDGGVGAERWGRDFGVMRAFRGAF